MEETDASQLAVVKVLAWVFAGLALAACLDLVRFVQRKQPRIRAAGEEVATKEFPVHGASPSREATGKHRATVLRTMKL
jgi:hypothetical protein